MQRKIKYLPVRLSQIFMLFPIRLLRIGKIAVDGMVNIPSLISSKNSIAISVLFWWFEMLLSIADLLGVSEIFESIHDFVKAESRTLNVMERLMAIEVFGDAIDYGRVRIDETALIATRKYGLKYVSFNIINSYGRMSDDLFIHEMMHVWQYQQVGAAYIARALKVHASKDMDYNYGGVAALRKVQLAGGSIFAFNYEAQGDIVADYFKLKNGQPPIWGNATLRDLWVYEYFMEEIRNSV